MEAQRAEGRWQQRTDGDDPAGNVYTTEGLRTLGLTKREYFSALVLGASFSPLKAGEAHQDALLMARTELAVRLADLLIAELNVGTT